MAGLLSKLKTRITRLSRQNNNPRVYTRERMQGKVERDDFLLAQIDEFR